MALSVPECNEDLLNEVVSRSEIRLEAWAFDRSQSNSAEPVKDLVHSATISAQQEPLVVARESEDGVGVVLVWEIQLHLTRPRVRMLEPSISIYSVMTVSARNDAMAPQEDMLQPFEWPEPNVLEPLRHVGESAQPAPYLAESRLEKVLPHQPKAKQQFRIEHMSPKYKIVPAAIARMTYTRVNTTSTMPKIIASLNVEIIPFIELRATIQTLKVEITHGSMEDLTPDLLPLDCRSRDLITFLYRLSQSSTSELATSPSPASQLPNFDALNVHLRLQVSVSDTCHPTVQTDFTTNVDFFQALNPTYGAPSQPMQRHNRPASLPLGGNGATQSQPALSTTLQPMPPMVNPSSFSGVTISFTAPDEPVKVGEPFTWRVLVNNRSTRPAKLAIYPLPRIPRVPTQGQSGKRHAPRTSIASYHSTDKRYVRENEADSDVAQAVMDENVVYAMQHSHTSPKQTDLVALTAEIRVGALGTGQCHESGIEMVALKSGTLKVDTMRVVDLIREAEEGIGAAGVMVDIRDLPDVVAVA